MNPTILEPRKALNKAFLKIKPSRSFIESFKNNLITLLDGINISESEEFHKNLVIDFLKKTYYDPNHYINTKGRNDLVIHNGKDAKSNVGVIIEAKSPVNKSEMISKAKLNGKALQELVLYYMRERITHKNSELKHLVVTNIYEWYIFDAQLFNKLFAENKSFVKQFIDFEEHRLSGNSTDYFYKEIAKPFIDSLAVTFEYTHFDIRNYDKPLRNADKTDDKQLISLFKLLSPEHLLKLSFSNDSNSLDKNFYLELLHILGLVETSEGGKKIIGRKKEEQRYSGSIIENTIIQLDSMDKLSRLSNPKLYGSTSEERLFSVALELTITWVNRILFLKLLEAQLISYQKGDSSYSFLNSERLKDYDNLNTLFFQVLAKKAEERNSDVQKLFSKVPYLNSSLFEMTELEHSMFPISQLEDNKTLPLLNSTVIKDNNGKKVGGSLNALHYFFSFLDAYDFASEGSEDIQEDNKTLINASVLGLIFEKINGYKDGSFFTPGFITMYMCKETIRRSVVQKFNEIKGWDCKDFIDLQNKKFEIKEANAIINSLKICDPAVGSGHFLVSALNEIISIKSKLEILADKEGRLLKHCSIVIENDELMIFDNRDGSFFKYNPVSEESQRIQETLFNEKQTIIENCLFGVDINPNSVKICRLRLWIELLKNAYYKAPDYKELETLPNIDINIKSGNSLISRFALDADLKKALKESKWNIESYKNAVSTYRDAESKEQKREMEELISTIKGNFRKEISTNSREIKDLVKCTAEYNNKYVVEKLFEDALSKAQIKNKKTLEEEIRKLTDKIESIKSNKMYDNAFEWRFEFPEVLNDNGDYIGFDAIIGNPPYIQLQKLGQDSLDLEKMSYETFAKTGDIYSLFYELGFNLLKPKGLLTFITSNKWMRAAYGESLRKFFVEKTNPLILIDFGGVQVFDTATVDTNILIGEKANYSSETSACILVKDFSINNISDYIRQESVLMHFNSGSWVVLSSIEQQIKNKIEKFGKPLREWDINIYRGILTGYNEAFIIDGETRDKLISISPKNDEIIRPILRGRDIQKYTNERANLWLIYVPWHFPLHKNPLIKGASTESEKEFQIQYPAIYNHLLTHKTKLSQRNKSETGIRYEWYALQRFGSNYMEDFLKPKIIWKRIGSVLRFSYDETKTVCLDSTCFATGSDLKYILGYLNSSIGKKELLQNAPKTGTGDVITSVQALEPLLIPDGTMEFKKSIVTLVNKCILSLEKNSEITSIQDEIDSLFINFYDFTKDELLFLDI